MSKIAALADVLTILTCLKRIDVSEDSSAMPNITQTMINTLNAIETVADANTNSFNIAACNKAEVLILSS